MFDNMRLKHLVSVVSQVRAATETLLDYFAQDGVPENSIQKIKLIKGGLDETFNNLLKEAYQDLNEQTIETLHRQRVIEWSKCLDDLLIIVGDVTRTIPLNHIREIERIVEELGPFIEARNKLIEGLE